MRILILIFSLGIFSLIQAFPKSTRKDYTNFHVYNVVPKNEEQLELLRSAFHDRKVNDGHHFRFITEPRKVGSRAMVVVSPKRVKHVEADWKENKINFKLKSSNLQKDIDHEWEHSVEQTPFRYMDSLSSFQLDLYHSHDEINAWLKKLADTYKDRCQLVTIGYSFEGRQMLALQITNMSTYTPTRKSFWIDAGIHAREWLSTSTAIFIINQLVTKYPTDSQMRMFVDTLNFIILPVANPDGYEYTRNGDRMWRKTRSTYNVNWFSNCYGADPNRNFPFQWGGPGTSTDPCSEIYIGKAPLSEPESKAMANYISGNNNTIKAMITLHTYSQLWLVPYGYVTPPVYPPDYNELFAAGVDGKNAIKAVYGTEYTVENSAGLYPAAGASDDWSKASAGIKWVYTLELRPSDNDESGFDQPATQIMPTGMETWEGVKVIVKRVIDMP